MMRGVSVPPMLYQKLGGSLSELEDMGVNLVRLHIVEGHWSVEEGFRAAWKIATDAYAKQSPLQFLWNIRLECACDYRAHLRWWSEFKRRGVMFIPNTWGFDVVNEPTDTDRTMAGYRGAMPVLHEAMRSLTDRWLVFQSGYGGTDTGFEFLAPFGDSKTMYAHNIYTPWLWTSQGLRAGGKYPKPFPEDLEQQILDENRHFFRFNDLYPDAKLMVPEFGLSKYVNEEDANKYIDTLLPMLEKRGISWCWHSYPARERPHRERLKHYWALNSQTHAHE